MGLFGGREKAREKYLDAATALMPILQRLEDAGGSKSPDDPDFPIFQRETRNVHKYAEKAGLQPGWLPASLVEACERMGHPTWPGLFRNFCGFMMETKDLLAAVEAEPQEGSGDPGEMTDAERRYLEVASVLKLAAASEVSGKDLVLCASALGAAGVAASLFVAEDGDDENDAEPLALPLRGKMLLVARTGSDDAVARVVSALAWYYPLKLAGRDENRENQDVVPFLQTLHQGLHPLGSLVVVTDNATIFDLYERATDNTEFAIAVTRWLARHLGDPNPDMPPLTECIVLDECLLRAWSVFTDGLDVR